MRIILEWWAASDRSVRALVGALRAEARYRCRWHPAMRAGVAVRECRRCGRWLYRGERPEPAYARPCAETIRREAIH